MPYHPAMMGVGAADPVVGHIPANLLYTRDNVWVRREGDTAVVGLTDFDQKQLGDVDYVGLPSVGSTVERDGPLADVESNKAVSDVVAPLSGQVVAANSELADSPEQVNSDPYGRGWLVRIEPSDPSQFDALLSPGAYAAGLTA